jgi:hypothetical protein
MLVDLRPNTENRGEGDIRREVFGSGGKKRADCGADSVITDFKTGKHQRN